MEQLQLTLLRTIDLALLSLESLLDLLSIFVITFADIAEADQCCDPRAATHQAEKDASNDYCGLLTVA